MKIVAVDYKGKHFILHDEDCVTDFDYIDDNIDIQHVIDHNLERYVNDCLYYGIPTYLGNNRVLIEKIKIIEDKIIKENL